MKKDMTAGVERRRAPSGRIALRSSSRSAVPGSIGTVTGYAALYNSWSGDLGGFREIIRPGAFADAAKHSDTRALWNHDASIVLGRSRSGTLRMVETEVGLYVEIDLPSTQAGRDALELIERGDVAEMSFAFKLPGKDGDEWFTAEDGSLRREILRVGEIFDVSPVAFPAYAETTVSVRSLLEARGKNPDTYLKKRGGKPASYFQKRLRLLELEFEARGKGRPVSYYQKRLDSLFRLNP